MSNRIGRLEFLFWFVASLLGSGILLAIVEGITHTAIRLGANLRGIPDPKFMTECPNTTR
jgi:hypothetical protein